MGTVPLLLIANFATWLLFVKKEKVIFGLVSAVMMAGG